VILNVDLSSEVPLYQQLRDRVVEGIAAGLLTEGSPLPPIRALAADFGINFHTVNMAYGLPAGEVPATCRSLLASFGTSQPEATP
jgi:GntR family transcriptional regulator